MFGLIKQQVLEITDCLNKIKRKEIEWVVFRENKILQRKSMSLRVFYKDESIDLMDISDIDGVHIIVI